MKSHCWKLFSTLLYLSAFTFGGGFVIIPLMQKRFVQDLGWLTDEEILDMVAFARSAPGAVTVNVAVQVGTHIAGIPGALCGIFGTIIPPLLILSAISLFYDAFSSSFVIAALLYGIRTSVAIVVADAVAVMVGDIFRSKEYVRWGVMSVVFILSLTTSINTIWLLAGGTGIGALIAGRSRSLVH